MKGATNHMETQPTGSVDAAAKLAAADALAAQAQGLPTEVLTEIARRFNAHPADQSQVLRMANVRMACLQTATVIMESVAQSRERSTALTLLEQVMMIANAGISRPTAQTTL